MPDVVEKKEKSRWFSELTALQEDIAAKRTAAMKGKQYRVLVEEKNENSGLLSARTEGNVIIEFEGEDKLIGSFVTVEVTEPKTWVLKGKLINTG